MTADVATTSDIGAAGEQLIGRASQRRRRRHSRRTGAQIGLRPAESPNKQTGSASAVGEQSERLRVGRGCERLSEASPFDGEERRHLFRGKRRRKRCREEEEEAETKELNVRGSRSSLFYISQQLSYLLLILLFCCRCYSFKCQEIVSRTADESTATIIKPHLPRSLSAAAATFVSDSVLNSSETSSRHQSSVAETGSACDTLRAESSGDFDRTGDTNIPMTNSTQATGSAHKQQQQQQPTSIRRRRRRRYTDQDTATATPSKPTLNQRIMSRRNIGSSNASEINNTNNQQTPPKSAHSDRAYQSSRKTKSTTNSNNSHGSMSSKSPIKEELPIFTEKPELKTFADEHSHIRLPCRVDKPQWDFRWSRDSYPIFSINGTDRTLVPDRFKYVGSPESGDCSIEIHDLQPQDGGLFQCRLISWLGDELDKKTVETKLTFQTTLVVVPAKAHSQQTSTASSDNNNNNNNNQDSTSILTQRDIPANGKQKVSHSSDHSTQQQQFSSSTQENWLPPSVQGNNMNNGPDVQATMLPNTNTHLTSFATNSNSSSSSIMNLTLAAVNWPYVLTALACLLMLVNVYLVVSLIKRSRCVTARSSNRSSSPSTGSNLSTSAITKQRKQQQQQLQQKPTTPASDYDTIKSKSLAAQVAVAAAERVAAAASSREHLQQQHQHLLQQQQQQQLQQQATTATTTTTLSSSSLSASDEQQSPQYLDLYLSTNNLAPNGINLGSDNYYSPHTIVTNLGPLQYADTSVALGWPATLI